MSHESVSIGSNEAETNETPVPNWRSQNPLVSSFFDTENSLLKQVKTVTLASLLTNTEQIRLTNSKYEKHLIDDYKSRMKFYISYFFDRNFDIFTPPPNLFLKEYNRGLFFEFYESQFKLISRYESGIVKTEFGYDLNMIPILECLETGTITRDLFCLLEKMQVKCYDSGLLLAKCTDFRVQPTKEFLIKLSIGSDVINYFANTRIQNPDEKQKLEFEKEALLLENPVLCTDPSPDVARIYSLLDGRKKMWLNHNDRSKAVRLDEKVERPRSVKTKPVKRFINTQPSNMIQSYQSQFDKLFENYHA